MTILGRWPAFWQGRQGEADREPGEARDAMQDLEHRGDGHEGGGDRPSEECEKGRIEGQRDDDAGASDAGRDGEEEPSGQHREPDGDERRCQTVRDGEVQVSRQRVTSSP